jgi:hypothetical protein
MRYGLSVLLFLLAGYGLSQDATLRPLPRATASLDRLGDTASTAPTGSTTPADLRRDGYVLEERSGRSSVETGRERSYTLEARSHRVRLVDSEYADYALGKRRLVFELTGFLKEGQSPADIAAIVPRLLVALQNAVDDDPAVAAGLTYLTVNSGSELPPGTVRTAVIDYLAGYRQPSSPLEKRCPGALPGCGFGDEYYGGPSLVAPLKIDGAAWTISGVRHFVDGYSGFTLEVVANVPRS